MSMHLVGPWLTTTSTKKRKKKLTKGQIAEYETNLKIFNRSMKQNGRHAEILTLDEYIDFCHGKIKERPKKEREFIPYTPQSQSFQRTTPKIPSLGVGVGVATKKESPKYTGTLIKGIATMHKSNAVPIINEQQAKEISSMRR